VAALGMEMAAQRSRKSPVSGPAQFSGIRETELFNATEMLSDGSLRDVTSSVIWHSSDMNVATVGADGRVTRVFGAACNPNGLPEELSLPMTAALILSGMVSTGLPSPISNSMAPARASMPCATVPVCTRLISTLRTNRVA